MRDVAHVVIDSVLPQVGDDVQAVPELFMTRFVAVGFQNCGGYICDPCWDGHRCGLLVALLCFAERYMAATPKREARQDRGGGGAGGAPDVDGVAYVNNMTDSFESSALERGRLRRAGQNHEEDAICPVCRDEIKPYYEGTPC